MKSILFFETPEFTGATRVTRTIAKKIRGHFETKMAVIENNENLQQEIQKLIEKEHPDILFCSFAAINPDVITKGKSNGLLVIVRQDYKLEDVTEQTRRRIFETYPKADWIIAQTAEMKQTMHSCEYLKDCKIKVIENPLDEEDILEKAKAPNPFPDNGYFHFLWVGRRDPIKDIPTLKKAFDIVNNHYPNTDLTLISDDSNPYRWIKCADCLVISSISEASPNVLREALFLGTIVISTDCSPSIRKMIHKECIATVGDANSFPNKSPNFLFN